MATLLERLRSCRDEMTASERQIANYLESGYPYAGLESARAVGERISVSAATVVRFIAKLGYSGYADFHRELRDEIEARLTSPLQRLVSPVPSVDNQMTPGSHDIVTHGFEAALAAVTRTYGAMERKTLEATVGVLQACKGTIWIIGEKKAHSVALYLYAQLNLCLERVRLLTTSASFDADRLLDVNADDVVIVIDVRRYVERSVLAANWCEARGATLVVFADSPSSPLFPRTPYRFTASLSSAGAFDSYIGLILLADILTNAVTMADQPRAKKRLELGESAWAQFHLFIGRTPELPAVDRSGGGKISSPELSSFEAE